MCIFLKSVQTIYHNQPSDHWGMEALEHGYRINGVSVPNIPRFLCFSVAEISILTLSLLIKNI